MIAFAIYVCANSPMWIACCQAEINPSFSTGAPLASNKSLKTLAQPHATHVCWVPMTRRLFHRSRTRSFCLALMSLPLFTPVSTLAADLHGMTGDWKTPGGSVVRLAPCANSLCLRVVTLSPTAPGTVDRNNPDASLRNRSLCNLEIGNGFVAEGDHATGGHIYDPMSGKTYKASIKVDGDSLYLRGYIGISAFGRTESWQRIADAKPCG